MVTTSAFKICVASRWKSGQALLLLNNQLCFALSTPSLAMTRHLKPLRSMNGLTARPQYLAMLAFWRNGTMMVQLGERLYLDSGAHDTAAQTT
jgi:hypothetical protein